jgi:hypothetical protein
MPGSVQGVPDASGRDTLAQGHPRDEHELLGDVGVGQSLRDEFE